jgi:hypothetical protein
VSLVVGFFFVSVLVVYVLPFKVSFVAGFTFCVCMLLHVPVLLFRVIFLFVFIF